MTQMIQCVHACNHPVYHLQVWNSTFLLPVLILSPLPVLTVSMAPGIQSVAEIKKSCAISLSKSNVLNFNYEYIKQINAS